MKRYVAVAGTIGAGKTSLVAGFLFAAGATNRLTRTDDGTTITDFDDDEIARKITISTAVAAVEWNKKKINLIDTPGFNMFVNDAKATLSAHWEERAGPIARRGRSQAISHAPFLSSLSAPSADQRADRQQERRDARQQRGFAEPGDDIVAGEIDDGVRGNVCR